MSDFQILRNMKEICSAMGVGRDTVLEWIRQGAPIAVEPTAKGTRYAAEARDLLRWRVRRSRHRSQPVS